MPKLSRIAIALSAFACAQPFMFADQSVDIDGTLNKVTVVGSSTTVSKGLLTEAKTNIGTVTNTTIRGRTSQTVMVGNSATVASSLLADAESGIGTINNSTLNGTINQTILVGSNLTRARSLGADAKTKIGTIDDTTINGRFDQTIVVGSVVTDARHWFKSATTCIGTIRGENLGSGGQAVAAGNVLTRSKSGRFLGISTGSAGAKSRSTYIASDGC
ncbi:MAG: hypothetical protein AAGA72_10235 [Pseudomonadota bacterium]